MTDETRCLLRYSLIKSKYAHCFHLPDKDGRLTYYERPGASEMSELKKLGVTRKDMVEHYMYCMEYLWQVRALRRAWRRNARLLLRVTIGLLRMTQSLQWL